MLKQTVDYFLLVFTVMRLVNAIKMALSSSSIGGEERSIEARSLDRASTKWGRRHDSMPYIEDKRSKFNESERVI